MARRYLDQLLEVPYFHYLTHLSDIWLLLEDETLLSWMWILPVDGGPEGLYGIQMIDTFVRGKNYAQRLIVSLILPSLSTLTKNRVLM